MENEDINKNVYTVESIFCGSKTANEVYKDIIVKILDKDCN